jgi:hypothetical protein
MNQKPLPPRLEDIPQDRLVHVGGPIDTVEVSLRLFGEGVEPDEITRLLGCQPTSSRRKGDVIPDKRYHRVASKGIWLLQGQADSNVELERQVQSLLEIVTDDLSIWHDLTNRFQVDIFCGLFLNNVNRGFALSPELMKRLADRRIKIDFDIYSNVDD